MNNYTESIQAYKTLAEQRRGHIEALKQQYDKKYQQAQKLITMLESTEATSAFVQTVAKATQDQITVHIEDIVSMAMGTILDKPYTFKTDFVVRRNKTECDLYFVRDGKQIKPIDESGGGAVDIASFASRIALWSLGSTDNILIFDEPFKFVSREYQLKVGELLKVLSEKLNLQIIMVSHNNNFIQQADTIITVTNNKGSKVQCSTQ